MVYTDVMTDLEKQLLVGFIFSLMAGLAANAIAKIASSPKKEPDESES
jgi:hypothetical protein